MAQLRLETATESIDLASVSSVGFGIEALSGVTGLGLPVVQGQWLDGAGDGSVWRGQRYPARDIDIPLYFLAPDEDLDGSGLRALVHKFAIMTAGAMTLRFIDNSGGEWTLDVRRIGGGDYIYGVDTWGRREMRTVLTVRAGFPFFTAGETTSVTARAGGRGLLKGTTSLVQLQMSTTDVFGSMSFHNTGHVAVFPTWKITGPGAGISISSSLGAFTWSGTLTSGQYLIVDARRASVVDQVGANRYDLLGNAPRFFPIPPGDSVVITDMTGTDATSSIVATYQELRLAVI